MSQRQTDSSVHPGLRSRFLDFCGRQWPRYLFLGLAGFLVHLPALQGQLVWDDAYLARDNPFIKSPLLAVEAFRHYLFLDSYSGHYRPVQNISFMIDYFLWNTDPTGFHLSSILLHVGSGLLLYRLLKRLFSRLGGIWQGNDLGTSKAGSVGAFLIAALWMVHPVHSAAVDYISGRADSLAFVCAAGGWLLVLRGRSASSIGSKSLLYSGAAILGLLALCAREITAVWLFIFLIHTFVFADGIKIRSKVATLICCVAIAGSYAGLRHLPGARAEAAQPGSWPVPVRAVLMLRALGDYGRLMIWPSHLHMERTVFNPDNVSSQAKWRRSIATEYLSMGGALVLAVFACGCVKRGSGQRTRIIGAIWFLSAYLPISNIVQLNATVAEHWLYLPSVGLLLFMAGCVLDLPGKWRPTLVALAGVAVVALGVRSAFRSGDWSDEETFYKRTLASGGTSCRVAVNLAQIYAKRGDYALAEKVLRHVLELTPDYPIARNNLAEVMANQGKNAEAEAILAKSAREAEQERHEYPRTWIAALNLAHLRHKAADDAGAISVLEHARVYNPQAWDLVALESELLRKTRGPDAALHLIDDFVRENWWHHAARLAEGRLYAENGDVSHSITALRFAALLDVHDTEALNLLARIWVRQNRMTEAYETQRRAVSRQPDKPSQYVFLSEILEKMGRSEEARAALAKVSSLQALAFNATQRR